MKPYSVVTQVVDRVPLGYPLETNGHKVGHRMTVEAHTVT